MDFHCIHGDSSGEGLVGNRRTIRGNPDSIEIVTYNVKKSNTYKLIIMI